LPNRLGHSIRHLATLDEVLGRFLEQALVRHARTAMKKFKGPPVPVRSAALAKASLQDVAARQFRIENGGKCEDMTN
jgi:hypothetical protein